MNNLQAHLNTRLRTIILVLLLLTTTTALGVLAYQYRKITQVISNPSNLAQNEKKAILGKLDNLMILPEEEPTMAKVEDKSKLNNDSFFGRADNGDFVIVFKSEKRAVLYRPSANKIVDITPITLSEDAEQFLPTNQTSNTGSPPPVTPEASNAIPDTKPQKESPTNVPGE